MRRLHRVLLLTLFALAPLALAPGNAVAQGFVVDAGDDVVLECTGDGGTEYTLNGTVPAGPDVTFAWSTVPPVQLAEDDTLTPTGEFPLGTTVVTLDAEDLVAMLSGTDSVDVTVEDTQPPAVQAQANPTVLWPPNHDMKPVEVRIRVRDNCSTAGDLQVELVSVESDEPDNGQGDGNTVDDIQDAQIGTDDRQVMLRAERSGGGDGRVYTLTYRVTDGAGNETDVETKVYVPHDYSDVRHHIMDDMDGDRSDMENICPRPEAAANEFIDALPRLASFPDGDACTTACRVWYRGCRGIVRGTTRCVYSEEKALTRLDVADCSRFDTRSERRDCGRGEWRDRRDAMGDLRAERAAADATCESVARRCANACGTLFDPNGAMYDDLND